LAQITKAYRLNRTVTSKNIKGLAS
jgi:hypothetical protein